MEWQSDYDTGDAAIDGQHHAFFDKINQTFAAMMVGDTSQVTADKIDVILSEMDKHFREEEDLMTRLSYPALTHHQGSHRRFTEEATRLRGVVANGAQGASTQAFEYLAAWTREHFAKDDHDLALFLREKRAA